MNAENRYHSFVRCHADTEETAYAQLCELVREEIEDLRRENKELPTLSTRPMRDVPIAA